ncbi:MAG: Undecaprenyl phosphate-alpha-4-amino-4-deoxy-L-arabinose arabinosyl transferase [Syntrophorhabdus sp. PtaU1.Bin050]|nr:MAG: Undecaprenyl phosphate-alpha-4-amino-4-deoxy-L-arabinose arabinosyl transferase [Syntrophorhabdus sp. PtaU1.Bin050]
MDVRNSRVKFYLFLLLVIVVPLFSLGLSNHGLWTADEPRVAEIGREMALNGNWSVPMLNQRPFLEQPPLYYASIAVAFKALGGPSDKIARIPSALFALGGVLALFFLGNMFFGPRIGFLSAFIMATCGEYFRVAHWVIVDSALACFILLALTFFIAAYFNQDRRKEIIFYGLFYVSCTLAFFTKGFIGIAIPGLAALTFLAFKRNWKEIITMQPWLGVVVFLVMALPWFSALYEQGGTDFLKVFFLRNHFERFAGGSTGHNQPFYYYLTQFPAGFLPWSLLIIPTFFRAFRKTAASDERSESGLLFAKCWFIAGFVLLSVASTKRILYLMPLFAPISLLTAWYIDKTLKRSSFGWLERLFSFIFGLMPLLLALATIPLYIYLSQKYALVTSWQGTGLIVAFSLAASVLALAGLWGLGKRHMARFWTFSAASLLSLLFLGLAALFPLLDQKKSFVPFCNDITATVPATAKLYAYKPDETLRGAVPFYTARFLIEIESLPSLLEAADREKVMFVVVRDSKGRQEREILSTGRFSVLSRRGDRDRSLVIFAGKPTFP